MLFFSTQISVIRIDATNHGEHLVFSHNVRQHAHMQSNRISQFDDSISKLTPEGAIIGNTKLIIFKMAAMVTGVTITPERA